MSGIGAAGIRRALVEFADGRSEFGVEQMLAAVSLPVDREQVVAVAWDLVEDGEFSYRADATFCATHGEFAAFACADCDWTGGAFSSLGHMRETQHRTHRMEATS